VAARTPLGSLGLASLSAAPVLEPLALQQLGPDLLWELALPNPSAP